MITLAAGVLNGESLALAHGLAMFQVQDSINNGNSRLLIIFVGLVAFALLVQAVVMMTLAIGGAKAQKSAMAEIAEIKAKLLPFIERSHALVNELGPQVKEITAKTNALITDLSPAIVGITQKINSISGHVEEISVMTRNKVLEFGPTISAANETAALANQTVRATLLDANEKTRAQVNRVNVMITEAIDATAKIVKAVEHGITQPAREVSGFVSGAKVTFEHLAKTYGGKINLSSLAGLVSLVGVGRKKEAPSPYTQPEKSTAPPVAPRAPEAMGSNESNLPSAFGSTRRDLDL